MTNLMFKAYFWTFILGFAAGAWMCSKASEKPNDLRFEYSPSSVPAKPQPSQRFVPYSGGAR